VPTAWNGNAFQIGGNGMNGFVPLLVKLNRGGPGSPQGPAFPPNAPFPIAQGYATYGDDSGHGGANAPGAPGGQAPATPQGGPPVMSFEWMRNAESLKNFGYEHVKKTHDVVMDLFVQIYGAKPKVNYFAGESQGGRAALTAIARYGADYDGVLVSVPLAYFTGIHLGPTWRQTLQLAPGAWIPPTKFPAIERESMRRCDGLDGLADGVINNYYACNRLFDPTVTPNPSRALRCADGADTGADCLSDAQIVTLDRFRAPMPIGYALANGETDWLGVPAGGESVLNWVGAPVQPTQENMARDTRGLGPFLGVDSFTPATFTWAKHQKEVQALSAIIDAPADWSAFLAKGGKVVFHTAANDYITNPRNHFRLYEKVVAKSGQRLVDRHVRFYVTPAADHGSRGYSFPGKEPQARYMNLVDVLERWVETGATPPEAVTQTLVDPEAPDVVLRSRPLCRYPKYPRYVSGDPKVASSYGCAAP
jgi:feruloyl esterase